MQGGVSSVRKTVVAAESLFLTNGSPVLAAFACKGGRLHQSINASAGERVLANTAPLQNLNAYHNRPKNLIDRIHRVSTKWLSRYLGWWRLLEGNSTDQIPDRVLRYALS